MGKNEHILVTKKIGNEYVIQKDDKDIVETIQAGICFLCRFAVLETGTASGDF